jgi:molybdopterin/thiamine biosynthesis adenylyltransferase
MHKREYSVALTERTNWTLQGHLIRDDREEDLMFALWTPSDGNNRQTALVHTPILPQKGDRQRHGNVSFNPQYFERVCKIAAKENCGIAFLHSHPGNGWQGMSNDDIAAESKMAGAVDALTDQPLLGMTVGNDGIWSARTWHHIDKKKFIRRWCNSVRVVGKALNVCFADQMVPPPEYREQYKRTRNIWGIENHQNFARLRVGIVGLGSVGNIVAASLARMGIERFVLIDFDEAQPHNLDRLLGATSKSVGQKKINIAKQVICESATAKHVSIQTVAHSVVEKKGYRAALDCDVLFSCVDRPRPRKILNHLAYAHLIPVVDGGIAVRFHPKSHLFSGAEWQTQIVAPGRPCLKCLGAYSDEDASTEEAGKLEDPSYMQGLPERHHLKQNENVFPFSANLASMEVMQFIEYVTSATWPPDIGVQRYRYYPGNIDVDFEARCRKDCGHQQISGQGDRFYSLEGYDLGAGVARKRQMGKTPGLLNTTNL